MKSTMIYEFDETETEEMRVLLDAFRLDCLPEDIRDYFIGVQIDELLERMWKEYDSRNIQQYENLFRELVGIVVDILKSDVMELIENRLGA